MAKKKKNEIQFEIEFFERLLERNPDFIDALIPLAELYTKSGNYQHGLLLDQRLAELKPEDAVVHYNMACSYALLGRRDEGFASLKRAIALGYDDFIYMDSDPDLVSLRTDQRYRMLVSEVVKKKKELRHGMDARNG
ncbi:MAG: hypothetical protein NC924_10170 [Candidatus Omnitrophica bacterium]|nr:hypothetical protein [Candidatus Omnitrophota bacterium]